MSTYWVKYNYSGSVDASPNNDNHLQFMGYDLFNGAQINYGILPNEPHATVDLKSGFINPASTNLSLYYDNLRIAFATKGYWQPGLFTITGQEFFQIKVYLSDYYVVGSKPDPDITTPAPINKSPQLHDDLSNYDLKIYEYSTYAWAQISIPDKPTISVSAVGAQSDVVAVVEGEAMGAVRFKLSEAYTNDIDISVSILQSGWQDDVSLVSQLRIPAGNKEFSINIVQALNDKNLDYASERGTLRFTARDVKTNEQINFSSGTTGTLELHVLDRGLAGYDKSHYNDGIIAAGKVIGFRDYVFSAINAILRKGGISDDIAEQFFRNVSKAAILVIEGVNLTVHASELLADLKESGNDSEKRWVAYKKFAVNSVDTVASAAFGLTVLVGSAAAVGFMEPLIGAGIVAASVETIIGFLATWGWDNFKSTFDGVTSKTFDVVVPRSVDTNINLSENKDFNADGTSDSLFRDNSTGDIVFWQMKGGQVQSSNGLGNAGAYQVAGTGDFNGDGTGDIVFQNGASVVAWRVQNGQVQASTSLGNAGGYQVVGTSDFNRDGTADVLFQQGGSVVAWQMQNGQVQSSNGLGNAGSYQVVGTGDLNGDGTDDIVFQDGASVVAWIMGNGQVQSLANLGNAGDYRAAGVGDLNGDGRADLVFQNGASVVDWIMGSNAQVQSANTLGNAGGYAVSGVGDYTGDGTADVLFQQGASVVGWSVQNGQVQSLLNLGNAGAYTAVA